MIKIKVIDLLNKIANGEKDEVFTEFEFNNEIYTMVKLQDEYSLDKDILNDEVKIIEEDKKIEKVMGIDTRETRDCIITFQEKLNELIEEVNKLKESK